MDASDCSIFKGPASGSRRIYSGDIQSPEGAFDMQTLEFMVLGFSTSSAATAGTGLVHNSSHPDFPSNMWAVDVKTFKEGPSMFHIVVDYKGCLGNAKLKRRESTQQEVVVWTTTNMHFTEDPADDSVTGYQLMIPATMVTDTYCTLTEPSAAQVGTNVTPSSAPSPAQVPSFSSTNVIQYVPSGWVLQSREKEAVGPSGGSAFVVTDTMAYYDPSGRPGAVNRVVNPPE